jgi:hypothetical protein
MKCIRLVFNYPDVRFHLSTFNYRKKFNGTSTQNWLRIQKNAPLVTEWKASLKSINSRSEVPLCRHVSLGQTSRCDEDTQSKGVNAVSHN